MAEYAQRVGVPVMLRPTSADMKKPVFQKYWRPPSDSSDDSVFESGTSTSAGTPISKIQGSKYRVLEAFFQKRIAQGDPVAPTKAVSVPEPSAFAGSPCQPGSPDALLRGERPPASMRDPFINSEYVYGLTKCNFRKFVESKDVSFVFFYADAKNTKTKWAKKKIAKAARKTRKENHGYAAVNCYEQPEVCRQEEACTFPMFKLYTRGSFAGTIRDVRGLSAKCIKNIVENTPVL